MMQVLDNIYITSQPSESFLNGNFKNVNLLIGSNTNEAAFFAVNLAQLSLLSIGNFDFFKYLLNFYYSAYQFLNQNQSVSFQNIIQLYIPTDVLNDNTTNYLDYIFQIGTDSSFKCPTIKLADYESQVNPNVYVYSYGYHISSSPYSSKYEAVHSEELYMVYAEPLSVKILPLLDESVYSSVYNNYSAYERNISETIVNYWGNFIKNQKPTLSTDEWPQFNNRNGDPINRSIKSLNGNESNVFNFQLNDTKYLFWTTGNTNTSTAPTTTTLSSTTMKGSAAASLSIKLQVFYLEFLFFLLFLF
jgi:carboxylesterase type B